uniref:E3 ubiquitin-protein ligase RNF10 n=1 Tax=Lepeophtheirus salmonis TaxID=72036 RepID=A0A0K2TF84_LEPSM
MRSRSPSPKIAMSDSWNPQVSCRSNGNSELGSKKQDAGNGRPRHASSTGARQKGGRPSKSYNHGLTPNAPQNYGGRRSNGGKSPKAAPSKEMISQGDVNYLQVGSVYNRGSKKSNYNHLLNFDYGPHRGYNDVRKIPHERESNKRKQVSPRFKYTKEHYLQANCQFLVKNNRDYSEHINDPDLPLDWEAIERVTLRTNDHPSCPICLYQPKVAKMTRCGHIYCWQCILHYLALSDDNWRKCPICDESVYKEDLKSVVTEPFSEHTIGDEIELNLMRRNRTSMFAYLTTKYLEEYEGKYPNLDQQYITYSKIVLASPEQIVSCIIEEEKNTLIQCYEMEKDEPESCFILEALNSLDERSKNLLAEVESSDNSLPQLDKLSLNLGNNAHQCSAYIPTFENLRGRHEHEEDMNNRLCMNGRKEFYNFYQSSDGQKIFLHGLNAKMLERQFGDLKDAPSSIKGKILEKEIVTVTEELRSKFRYLHHLPLLSNIEFLELNLTSIHFDDQVVDEFKQQIDNRKRKRNRKARDERKREKKIMIEENKLMGKYPDPKYRIESIFHFPDIGQDISHESNFENASSYEEEGVATFAKVSQIILFIRFH